MPSINNKYYYLVSGLPELNFDNRKISFEISDIIREFSDLMSSEDFEDIRTVLFSIDLRNIVSNFIEKSSDEFEANGNFNYDELEYFFSSSIKDIRDDFNNIDDLIVTFISYYNSSESYYPNMSWSDQLALMYYNYALESSNNFLKEYFLFEKDLKNILIALIAAKYNFSPEVSLLGSNDTVHALKTVKSKDYGLSGDYPFINRLITLFDSSDFYKRELEIDKIKWDFIEDLNSFEYFSSSNIMGFLLKYTILNRWAVKSEEKGKKSLDKIFAELEKSYELPEQFRINN